MAHLRDFGVETHHKIIRYRGGKVPHLSLRNNFYAGKQFWYKKKLYTCIESTTNTVTAEIDGKITKVHRKEILAPKDTIPVYKQLTTTELLGQIKKQHPDAELHVPRVGCQLHGDIDATLTINGKTHNIPWNY